jgi:hypothetical protein
MSDLLKKEISVREADGITVTLYAHFAVMPPMPERISALGECVEISCHVVDSRTGTEFTISDVPRHKALDVFYHPFAAADSMLTAGVV